MEVEVESCWLLLLCCMALHSEAIETVNVVDFCGQNIRGDGMIVNSHQESKKYYFVTMGTDCHLTMQASSPKDKVQFHFRFFLVYSLLRVAPLSPAPLFPESPRGSAPFNPRLEPTSGESLGDPCHAGSYVQFYDGRNYLTLRLVTRGTQPRVDFVGDFTSFRLGFNQSECSNEPYFTCRNGKCIPLSLVCEEKGIDNCGDGSDLEENLTTGCKAPVPTRINCGVPDSAPSHESTPPLPAPVLVLYIVLGVVGGGVVLCWCCLSPGWFLWRLSVCRFLPCCNSACASCQLCARSCTHSKEHRLAKVTPHTPANGTLTGTAPTNSADENVTAAV
ncbi:hypothetical protein F7725_017638 [Dissostichus mawsoni]|uniref:Low density lipoprotein receptor class A domain containing 2 n=1 Tax=Dissostichus mawsoni TaxID=36200 RepID=A0A7J5Z573_DISMA|nr:hypothetical protein F7725_017638 [Dissostichus mawsoni]